MSKTKMVPDPTEGAGRERVNGPQPEIEEEQGPIVMEDVRAGVATSTEFGANDYGVPTIRVSPLRIPQGNEPVRYLSGGGRRIRTVMDGIREQAAEHAELREEACRQIIPSVQFYGAMSVCSMFQGVDGNHQSFGVATWCHGIACPSMKDSVCAMGKLSYAKMLIRTVEPANLEEYERLLQQEGAEIGSDYESRVKQKMAEIGAARAQEIKAKEADHRRKAQQEFDARKAEQLRPKITPIAPGESLSAAIERAKGGRA